MDKPGIVIPGFGQGLRAALLAWVNDVKRNFRFDPRRGVPETERRARVVEYRRRQAHIEGQMKQTLAELRRVTDATRGRAEELRASIEQAAHDFEQARADMAIL